MSCGLLPLSRFLNGFAGHTSGEAPPEGPPPRWRFDFLFFAGLELVSRVTERAPRGAAPHHSPGEVRAFAARLFEMTTVRGGGQRPDEASRPP